MNFLIFNKHGDVFEATGDNIHTLTDALDQYIQSYLIKNKSFSIENEPAVSGKNTIWSAITEKITDDNQVIAILNGFCHKEAYKITKIIYKYESIFEKTSTETTNN